VAKLASHRLFGQMPGASSTLGDLQARSLEDRYAFVLFHGADDLTRILDQLRERHVPLPETVTSDQLAWAAAFNIAAIDDHDPHAPAPDFRTNAKGERIRRKPMKKYSDSKPWSVETPWEVVWSMLTKTDHDSWDVEFVRLADLAMSVACEQRLDWQHRDRPSYEPEGACRMVDYLIEQHTPVVRAFIASRMGPDPEIEELVAEVWARMLRHWGADAYQRYRATGSLRSYLCGIGRNVVHDEFERRGEARRIASLDDVHQVPANEPVDFTGPINPPRVRQQLLEAIWGLTKNQRQALILTARGMTQQEIADKTGAGSRQTINDRLTRARLKAVRTLKALGLDRSG
jgi:RNA polymerase sigma factor (sigma-70 family)